MKEIKGTKSLMHMLMVVWILSLLFSSVMFTLSLMYDVNVSLYISCVTGVLSCIGVFYTGNILIRIKNTVENEEKL